MLKKLFISLKSIGFKRTIVKLIFKIFNYLSLKNYKRKKFEKNLFKTKSVEERFNKIYSTNYWLDNESRSGTGSSLRSTENIRFHLLKILEKFNIKKLFDAPCGDFNWMSQVLKSVEIDYLGSDIVKDLIVSNKKYENDKIKFSKLDIIVDKLPVSDLMICRDCLFHFSYKDIVTGDFRKIDLFSKPFNFEKNYIYSFDDKDKLEIQHFKQMYLFSKLQIKNILLNT